MTTHYCDSSTSRVLGRDTRRQEAHRARNGTLREATHNALGGPSRLSGAEKSHMTASAPA